MRFYYGAQAYMGRLPDCRDSIRFPTVLQSYSNFRPLGFCLKETTSKNSLKIYFCTQSFYFIHGESASTHLLNQQNGLSSHNCREQHSTLNPKSVSLWLKSVFLSCLEVFFRFNSQFSLQKTCFFLNSFHFFFFCNTSMSI